MRRRSRVVCEMEGSLRKGLGTGLVEENDIREIVKKCRYLTISDRLIT